MNLKELFQKDVVTMAPMGTVFDAARRMRDENVGAVVVVENEKPVGIVTDRDVAMALTIEGVMPATAVREIMTSPVVTIWEDEGVFNASQYFLGHGFRRLPIVDRQNRLVGLITTDDMFALLTRELFNVSKAIEPALTEKM